jgi:hypothetical protein
MRWRALPIERTTDTIQETCYYVGEEMKCMRDITRCDPTPKAIAITTTTADTYNPATRTFATTSVEPTCTCDATGENLLYSPRP